MGFSGGCDLLQELVSGCFLIGNDALFLYCIKVSVSLNYEENICLEFNVMKITCPNCNIGGNIPEHEIPLEGRFLNCPRCKHGFTVFKPKADKNIYLVDTCPACNFSTFGDDQFSTCPKCGVVVKAYMERQKDEQVKIREHELLTRKMSNSDVVATESESVSPAKAFTENLSPVNIVGYGSALVAITFIIFGFISILGYSTTAVKEQILAQRDIVVSSWYVFWHFGFLPWLYVIYGAALMVVAYYFIQQKSAALNALTIMVRILFVFIPIFLLFNFVSWIIQPVSHSIGGYLIEILNLLLMFALFCTPLFFLDRFLMDKRITSVVKL